MAYIRNANKIDVHLKNKGVVLSLGIAMD